MLPGCASIVAGQNQSLSVDVRNEVGEQAGAKCTLINDKGTWYVTTPGSVTVRRSYEDLSVACASDADLAATGQVRSSTKAMAFGNILFGGVIGVGVDVATGAAYDYPPLILLSLAKAAPAAPERAAEPAPAASSSGATK